MSSVEQIESAVSGLSQEQLARFGQWFREYEAEVWDRRIDGDAKNGKLDALYEHLSCDPGVMSP